MQININIEDNTLSSHIISLMQKYIKGELNTWINSIQYQKDNYCNISNPSWNIIITDTNNTSHTINRTDITEAIQLLFHDKPQTFCNIITGNNDPNSIDMLFQYACYRHSFYNK